ncbi:MAG: glycosyltransferase family 2 protein, partial [Miltoncostaeaceae bacterium]
MKLIIQIPCLNEEGTLPETLAALPRRVAGFDAVEWLVIDDGSTDSTAEVARAHGVDHVVSFPANRGLADAFQAGIDAALKLDADVIVNTDADNQYRADDIPTLVAPILAGDADVVIGDRGVADHPEFTPAKRVLQNLGSWVVRKASGTGVADTTSGFRAYSRTAALGVNVTSRFTYTLETIIQAGHSGLVVTSVPIGINPAVRPSRLFRSSGHYVRRSAGTIVRQFVVHRPLAVFMPLATIFGLVALILLVRFGVLFLVTEGPTGHVQSLVVGTVSGLLAVQFVVLGMIADLLRTNRILLERSLRRIRAIELSTGVPPDGLDDGRGEDD